mgnify:FL=1
MILSVSRRTDIPAFYSDWFFECLEKGYVLVPNPINPKKIAKIPLKKFEVTSVFTNLVGDKDAQTDGNVEGIVFWSKNPQPLLSKIDKLKDYVFYTLYTLNAYPDWVEGGLPSIEDRINTFIELSHYCPVIWRYDPILLTKGIDVDWHIKNYKYLCESLKGYTKHCKISFVIPSYSGCSKDVYPPNEKEKDVILSNFKEIAKANGIQIEACAVGVDLSKYDIAPSKCIDGEIFEVLLTQKYQDKGLSFKRKNNKIDGQRKYCGCMPAVDIGRYDTCNHNCNYCYARKSTHASMLDKLNGEVYEKKTEFMFDIT